MEEQPGCKNSPGPRSGGGGGGTVVRTPHEEGKEQYGIDRGFGQVHHHEVISHVETSNTHSKQREEKGDLEHVRQTAGVAGAKLSLFLRGRHGNGRRGLPVEGLRLTT